MNKISAEELKNWIDNNKDFQLLDVRELKERELFALPDTHHIPIAKILGGYFDNLILDKPVVLYCQSGGRSARAAKFLKQNGFEKVYSLDGGIIKYRL